MWWLVVPLLVVAFVGYTMLLNAQPARCPSCRRVNILRRRRTGPQREKRDDEGILLRMATEFVCGRCNGRCWIARDDFAGCRATVEEPDLDV